MKKILITIGVLVVIGAGALWYSRNPKPTPEAAPASRSDTTLIQDSTIGTNKIENVTVIHTDSTAENK